MESGSMDRSQPEPSGGVGDRLSKLEDRVLGNILSFLPAKEAARGALLSSRWRHVFAAVHTLSLEEPESPIRDDNWRGGCNSPSCRTPADPNAPPPFTHAVSAAIIARQRRRGAAPLRALRVAMEEYRGGDSSTVDQWVSYAVQQAAPDGLDLDLRFVHRRLLCHRPYQLRRGNNQQFETPAPMFESAPVDVAENPPAQRRRRSTADGRSNVSDSDDSSAFSTDDERDFHHLDLPSWQWDQPEYSVPRLLFSCAELRSLSLGSCRLAPPATVSLPSLVTLLLSHVPDPGADVERLIAGCPRLADLTLEACYEVTALTVVGGARLRRLALRSCHRHRLATVAIDSSELQAFEYQGAVPDGSSFLTMHGGSGRVAYCKVDIRGAEATSEEELTNLWQLLQLFVNAKHLHLESARLGSRLGKEVPTTRSASFSSLRHLEVRGCLPDDDDTGVIDAMIRILEHAPNLDALSLAFHYDEHDWGCHHEISGFREEELLDTHHLGYNPHSVLAVPSATIPCLRSRVREINLVHYQGGRAQRALAKFLLCNAPAVDRLWCEFAEGPMWTQVQLMREIKGWLINKSASTHFA